MDRVGLETVPLGPVGHRGAGRLEARTNGGNTGETIPFGRDSGGVHVLYVPICENLPENVGSSVSRQEKFSDLPLFSARLRSLRKEMGLNQAQFGALGGISMNSQNRYEAAATEPGLGYLMLLANAGVDVGFLLTGARAVSNPTQSEPGDAELLEMYRQLAIDTKEALVALTNNLAVQPQLSTTVPRTTLHGRGAGFRGEDEG